MNGIRLNSVDYHEFRGKDREWSLTGLKLGRVNLLVGKNATGKTRAINVIGSLASQLLFDARTKYTEVGYAVEFSSENSALRYELTVNNHKVSHERLVINNDAKLFRDATGLKIFAEEQERFIPYTPPPNEVAAVARRDSLQHPYLIPLHDWAQSVRHYHFNTVLGKEHLWIDSESASQRPDAEFDDRDENKVVAIFARGKELIGDRYVQAVLTDMNDMGYKISRIEVQPPLHIAIPSQLQVPIAKINSIAIEESGVPGLIFQENISDGMFRALSILAQVNYSQMARRASCILIDDVGEGLDFDRSAKLIEILRKKALTSDFQLIMTTNDQFVMNHVPLEEWSVLQRSGNAVTVRNHLNSKEQFEEFRFVGLSNFTFFEMDFINGTPECGDDDQEDGGVR